MSDAQFSSSSNDDVDHHTCDEDDEADYHTCDEEDVDEHYLTCDEEEQESGDPRAASPSSSFSDDGRDLLDYHHSSDDEEEEELDVLGAAAPVVTVKKETRQLYTRSLTGLDNEVQEILESCGQKRHPVTTSGSRQDEDTLEVAKSHTRQVVPMTGSKQGEDTLAVAGSQHRPCIPIPGSQPTETRLDEETLAVARPHFRQIVPTPGSQHDDDSLAIAPTHHRQVIPTYDNTLASAEGGYNALVQLNVNVTQQQFGDVTVENATNINQSFGGNQNISKTATFHEEKKVIELSRSEIIMKRTLEHIEAWNQGIVKTAALSQVLDKLENGATWLTIKGNPGEGKTTVGHMALEEMHRRGRLVFEVRSPDEFTEVISTCSRPIIMLDDVFGNLEFDQTKWSTWEPVVSPLLKEREHKSHEGKDESSKKDVTIILIGRDFVLNSAYVDLGRLSDFLTSDKHVVCMDHSMKRYLEEKRAIWESISRSSGVDLDKETLFKILSIEVAHGFPHVCHLFATIYKENKSINAVEFFSKPLGFLNKSISYLFKDTNKVMLFQEMVKCEAKISRKELRKLDKTYKMLQVAENLVGSYLKRVDDYFVFDHPSIYDSVAFHMCSLDPEFVIQECHLSFIHERVRLQLSENSTSENTSSSSLVVYVDRSYEDELAERFAKEIMVQNFVPVLSHQAFTDGTFVGIVMSKLKSPLKSLIHLADKNSIFSQNTFLSLVPSSKSAELLKYIDSCIDIVLSEDDEKEVLFGTCRFAASEVLLYLKGTRKSLDKHISLMNVKYCLTPLMMAAATRDIPFVHQILSLKPDLNARGRLDKTALHYVCEYGLVSCILHLINNGADIDAQDYCKETPLYYACVFCQLDVVQLLIQTGARVDETSLVAACRGGNLRIVELLFEKETNCKTGSTLTNALSAASEGGNTDIMKLLVDKGASVTSFASRMPPLHAACHYKQRQALQWLLQQGIDVNSRDLDGNTALNRAADSGSQDCVEVLIKAGASVNIQNYQSNTPLHKAAESGSEECVNVLLKAGAYVNIQNKEKDTSLHNAASSGSIECVDELLKEGALVNIENKENDTALHKAAGKGSKESIAVLLKAGATVNTQNKKNDTALHKAAGKGSKESIAVLLKAGATVNTQNQENDTALHKAAGAGSQESIAVLLKAGATVNTQNKKNDTALHIAAKGKSKDCVEVLLKLGASVNIQNNGGNTALHMAAFSGSKVCAELLLKASDAVNIQNKQNDTALHIAARFGYNELVDVLLKASASFDIENEENDTPLHKAAGSGSKGCIEVLLKAGAQLNKQNKHGDTALHKAARSRSKMYVDVLDENGKALHKRNFPCSEECVEVLLKACAAVNIQNKKGDTPLHETINGFLGCTYKLLNAGATVNMPNKEGETALHKAAAIGSKECVNVLLKAGATVNVQNGKGDTALHLAALLDFVKLFTNVALIEPSAYCSPEQGSEECVDMLLKAGATVNMPNKEGETALHKAAIYGSEHCVIMLMKAGATLNVQNNGGDSPLHYVCKHFTSLQCLIRHFRVPVCHTLILQGADVNAQNYDGDTPLHVLCNNPMDITTNIELAELLIENGANVDIHNKQGEMPLLIGYLEQGQ